MKNDVYIAGVGTWFPDRIVTNDEWPTEFKNRIKSGDRTFNDIESPIDPIAAQISARDLAIEANDPFLASIHRRRADDAMTSREACVIVAKRALDDAGIDGQDVDIVITNDVIPDTISALSSAGFVSHGIGASRAMAFTFDAACSSGVVGINLAEAYLRSGAANVVVVALSHLMLRTVDMMHPASPGLGDAASAIVMTRRSGRLRLIGTHVKTYGEFADAVVWVSKNKNGDHAKWWKPVSQNTILGTANVEHVKMLMRETVSFASKTIMEICEKCGLDPQKDIDRIAMVQPRGFIPRAVAERLGLERDQAVVTYEEYAHLGNSGPIVNLERALQQGLKPGQKIVLYGQGAGFTCASAILEVI